MRLAPLVLVAACSSPPAKPVTPPPLRPVPVDAPTATDDEKLAAIQKAMNELDEGVQACWASAATERFDIEGELKVMIDIGPPTAATIVEDTSRNPRLASCVVAVLQSYPWAPPLYGQAIQLPFRFRAPDGQSVIDRKLIAWNGQGKVSVSVLLDSANTGNDDASMFELALQAGGTTGMRTADRTELWYFLGPATVGAVGAQGKRQVAAGDMAWVRKGGAREVIAGTTDVRAVIVMFPGGREGSARVGALPTPPLDAVLSAPVGATLLPAKNAKQYGPALIYAEPAVTSEKTFSASILTLPKGATVAEHVHQNETEMLYILTGSGTMTVAGVQLAVTPTSVVQIPQATKHSFTASADVRALQIYTPAGPEQRFKKPPTP
ncbi:MAG: cupin domain-containing protein [Deltaproteobacteria bacterium]|nr:cupin domain-containing protein [Deltaproteobacteria bacterium]